MEQVREPATLGGSPTRSAGSTTARRSPGCSSRSGSSRHTGRWPLARGVRIPPEYELAAAIGRRIELACLADPIELRPCHNDLLNANFIDDGVRIRIVDWEYAGMGDPYFDLGNFSINHELTPDDDAALLADVPRLGRRPTVWRGSSLMRVVSDFREAMWGVLQQGISTLDVDFVAYAAEHFDRLLANATTPAFERALREAAGD